MSTVIVAAYGFSIVTRVACPTGVAKVEPIVVSSESAPGHLYECRDARYRMAHRGGGATLIEHDKSHHEGRTGNDPLLTVTA